METHELYMQRAINLAKLGAGSVAPNPQVGCVIVHENKIIGEGFHQKYGEAHAEVNAINSVREKELLKEGTVYVSLEPCAHFGKTPPCANLLIDNKVKTVVICNTDPNPLVAGKGIELLKAAGIEVFSGILEKEGRELNKMFFAFFEKKRPYITLKWAQTSDGFIASENGKPTKISNEITNKFVHKLRAENSAIMVGTNTVFADNPNLTTRNWLGQNPVRVLIDKQLRFKQDLNIFNNEAQSLIYNLHGDGKIANAQYIKLPENEHFLENLLDDLHQRNILSVMIEGGTNLVESFLKLNLWDEAIIIVADKQLNYGVEAPKIDLSKTSYTVITGDKIFKLKN